MDYPRGPPLIFEDKIFTSRLMKMGEIVSFYIIRIKGFIVYFVHIVRVAVQL